MIFWLMLGLVVVIVNVAAVVLGWRLRAVQSYHLVPPETHRFPEPVYHCNNYMEAASGQCLWSEPGSNGLACSLRTHRACTRYPQEAHVTQLPFSWDSETREPVVPRRDLQTN